MKIPARWRVAIVAALVLSLLNSAAVNRQQEGQEKRLADVEAKVKKIEDYLYYTVAPLVNEREKRK